MRIRIVSLFLLLWVAAWCVAQPRTSEQARRSALAHLNTSMGSGSMRIPAGESMLRLLPLSTDSIQPDYYVFNISDNRGFIVVSGDVRAREILAWSDRASFAT